MIVGGDVLTHPLISFETSGMAADRRPLYRTRRSATRRKLLDRLATDRTKLIGFHLPYPGVGTVERSKGAYRFVPIT